MLLDTRDTCSGVVTDWLTSFRILTTDTADSSCKSSAVLVSYFNNALMRQIVGEPSTLGNVPPASLLSRSLPRSETGTSESYQEQNRKTAHRQQRSIQERPDLLM